MAETLAGLGGKLAARRGASFAAVPVVPGRREPAPVGDLEAAGRVRFDAEGAGWPLVVKASARRAGGVCAALTGPEICASPCSPRVALVRPLSAGTGQASGTARIEVVIDGWRFEAVVAPARRTALRDLARREHAAAGGSLRVVRAPLRGRIVRIWVGAGGRVEPGARLCSLEAMKISRP